MLKPRGVEINDEAARLIRQGFQNAQDHDDPWNYICGWMNGLLESATGRDLELEDE